MPRGKSPRYPWIGGWVGPRAGLDDVEKRTYLTPPGLELRPLGRPARSQSLYRLLYPGSDYDKYTKILVGKPEVKRQLGRPRSRWKINIKLNFVESVCDCGSELGSVASSSEHDNVHLALTKGAECSDWLRGY
jgi:hypothetical protein